MEPHQPVRRGILAMDIERYSRVEWTDDVRSRLRHRLYRIVDEVVAVTGIDPAHVVSSDAGDGVWLLVAAAVPVERLLHPLAACLTGALADDNAGVSPLERMRLRLALHAGDMIPDPHGQAGASLIHTARLLNADVARAVLSASPVATAVVVISDPVYGEFAQRLPGGFDPAAWRPVPIRVKETRSRAWLSLAAPGGGGWTPDRGPRPPTRAGRARWRAPG
jgi:hypothetical protein